MTTMRYLFIPLIALALVGVGCGENPLAELEQPEITEISNTATLNSSDPIQVSSILREDGLLVTKTMRLDDWVDSKTGNISADCIMVEVKLSEPEITCVEISPMSINMNPIDSCDGSHREEIKTHAKISLQEYLDLLYPNLKYFAPSSTQVFKEAKIIK